MADETQVKLLKEKGVEAWNEWRGANPSTRPDLSGADLSEASLVGANLSEVYLGGAFLDGASLWKVDLSKANLTRAFLRRTDLRGTDFSNADLSGAILSGADLLAANFFGANLNKVDLSEARLIRTDFSEANLKSVDFSKAIVGFSNFADVDLSETRGMETVKYRGPSEISINTVYRSQGKISLEFLRGAGVPENFIEYMHSLVAAMSPVQFYSCFISYSHADKAFARRLHDALQSKGIRCWLDEHQLLPGDDIYHEVDRGIRLWDKMLLCCSESSLTSWWVDNEIGTAFDKEQQLMKDREGTKVQVLVPLNLDGYLFSDKWKSGYQAQVRRRLTADFTESGTGTKFDEQVERLIKALRADEGAREKPPKSRL